METARLLIRKYSPEDLEFSVALYGDAEITKLFDHGEPRSAEQTSTMIKGLIREDDYGLYTIVLKDSGIPIGHCDVMPGDDDSAEIGAILAKEYQSKGYATEAVRLFVTTVVSKLGVKAIMGTCHPENLGSRAVMEKAGMQLYQEKERFGRPRLWFRLALPARFPCSVDNPGPPGVAGPPGVS